MIMTRSIDAYFRALSGKDIDKLIIDLFIGCFDTSVRQGQYRPRPEDTVDLTNASIELSRRRYGIVACWLDYNGLLGHPTFTPRLHSNKPLTTGS